MYCENGEREGKWCKCGTVSINIVHSPRDICPILEYNTKKTIGKCGKRRSSVTGDDSLYTEVDSLLVKGYLGKIRWRNRANGDGYERYRSR